MKTDEQLRAQYVGKECTFNGEPAKILAGESFAVVGDCKFNWATVQHIVERCEGRFATWNRQL